ncbi:MAG: hypothetical protein AB8C13_09010 [Phycisphaerales bacterium]
MTKSYITVSAAGLAFIASVLLAFEFGTTFTQPAQSNSLVMVSNQVQFVPASVEPAQISDGQISSPQGTAAGSFIYQGVLIDSSGNPATGPLQITFTLFSILPTPINFTSVAAIVNFDEQGLFQVFIPLPDPEELVGIESLGVRVRLTETGEVIDLTNVRYTPIAWFSEYAATSGFADEAQEAEVAQTADALTNDQTVSITLGPNFSPAVFGGQAPYATRLGNMVFLNGAFRTDVDNPNSLTIGTLPPNMRPSAPQFLAIHSNLSMTSGNAAVTVSTDGTIRMLSSNYSAGISFFLNGAYFTID